MQHVPLDDLVIAMEHGHLQMLRLLANRGVTMEQVKAMALDRAAVKKFPEIVEFFRGADSLVHPSVITIDNHRSCNVACRMCPTQPYDAGGGAMSEAVFAALVSQIADFRESIEFVLFGVHGEPLLDKRHETRVADSSAGHPRHSR
jgi:sulfatase maturation enzyme AslB (radical SAM superfamily)